jgi:outer membrane biosynthesis protein TonB
MSLRCSRGHTLVEQRTRRRDGVLMCDKCKGWCIEPGEKVFSCLHRDCLSAPEGGYDICPTCHSGRPAEPEGEESEGGSEEEIDGLCDAEDADMDDMMAEGMLSEEAAAEALARMRHEAEPAPAPEPEAEPEPEQMEVVEVPQREQEPEPEPQPQPQPQPDSDPEQPAAEQRGRRRSDTGMRGGRRVEGEKEAPNSASKAQEAHEPQRKRPTGARRRTPFVLSD